MLLRPSVIPIGLLLLALVACQRSSPPPAATPEGILAARILPAVEASHDPWALAHGLVALPPGSDRQDRWLARIEAHLIEEDGRWQLPLSGVDGERGEQHPYLVLRTLALLEREGRATEVSSALLERLLPAARAAPAREGDWRAVNDLAWRLEALSDLAAGDQSRVDALAPMARRLLAALVEGDVLVETVVASGDQGQRPDSGTPEESGTWAYTCGGQHLILALLASADAGVLDAEERQVLSSHLDLYCRRLRWEEFFRLREEIRALGSGVSATRAFRRGILERLKLSGHGLEILARARSASVGDPLLIDDAREISEVMLARDMSMLAGRVDPDGTLLKKLKTTDPELWERWLGDGCHVLHGLRLWQLDRR